MALAERRSARLAAFPPTSVLDIEVMESAMQMLEEAYADSGGVAAMLNKVSTLLERAEQNFQQLVGDPYSAASQRSHFSIGKLAGIIQRVHTAEATEVLVEQYIEHPEVTLEKRVAGLRFLLACMTAWGLSYPLTEETFVTRLRQWASERFELGTSESPSGADSHLKEAQRTYAAGLLAIALTNTAHCEEAVRSGFIGCLVSYLHSSIARLDSSVELRSPSNRQQPVTRLLQGNPHPVVRPLQVVSQVPLRAVNASGIESASSPDDEDVRMETECDASSPSHSFGDGPEDAGGAEPTASASSPMDTTLGRLGRLLDKEDASLPSHSRQLPLITNVTEQPAAVEELPSAERVSFLDSSQSLAADASKAGDPLCLAALQARRLQHNVQCAASLGEYLEFLAPLLAAGGMKMVLRLLDAWRSHPSLLNDALRMLGSLLAHRKLADALVDDGGLELLLALPSDHYTHTSLSLVQVGLTLVPSAFQRLVALPAPIPGRFVEAAMDHLSCPIDAARKNAAVFLGNALVQPVILDAFDRAAGLKRLMAALSGSLLLLRSGTGQELRQEKQVCYHLCQAQSLYFRIHLVQRIRALSQQPQPPSEPAPVDTATLDAHLATFASSKDVAAAFVRRPWLPVDSFTAAGGPSLMLDIIQASPGERYFTEMANAALEVLQVVTLLPSCRGALLACTASSTTGNQQTPVAILLSAAGGQAFLGDNEVKQAALRVILNFVAAPQSLSDLLPGFGKDSQAARGRPQRDRPPQASGALGSVLEQGYAAARAAVRNANGLRTMLSLVQSRPSTSSVQPAVLTKLRALAAQALLGLAQDPNICHTLTKLQVGKKLAELVHETAGSAGFGRGSYLAASGAGGSCAPDWREAFLAAAMELIALTTPGVGKIGSVAACDAAAPALHKMERAAIAAASHITFEPQELLLLLRDHLMAAGLDRSADMLTREAGLRSTGGVSRPWGEGPRSGGFADLQRPSSGAPFAKKQIAFTSSVLQSAAKQPGQQSRTAALRQPETLERASSLPSAALHADRAGQRAADGSFPEQQEPSSTPRVQRLPSARRTAGLQLQQGGADFASPKFCQGGSSESPALGGRSPEVLLSGTKRAAPSQLGPQPHPIFRSGPGSFARRSAQQPGFEEASPWTRRSSIVRMPSVDSPADNGLAYLDSLASLPSRRAAPQPAAAPVDPCQTPLLARSVLKEALASPPGAALGATATAGDRAVGSRLSTIVLQYLRQQHKAACMSARQPVSTLPPLSLVHPNTLPQAQHMLDASKSTTRRMLEGQVAPFGGIGGRRQHRHFVYGRFRHRRSIRDRQDGTAVLKSCSFMAGGEKLLVGTLAGQVRLYQDYTSDIVEEYEAHAQPVNKLQVYESGGRSLVLTSARSEVKLWDASRLDHDPLSCFDGCRGGVFSPDARFIAATTARNTAATVFDAATFASLLSINEADASGRAVPRDICYSRTGELLLWGPALWDPRAPRRIHRFDVFAENCGGSIFHPAGLEAILNSEVWDLRTFRLLRSVPCLDNTNLVFNSTGDVAYAFLRRTSEDLSTALQARRSRHPLHTAFRTVDTTDYREIGTIEVDGRCVLDIAAEPLDSSLAMITVEPEGLGSSTRIYDIGRRRVQGDESDYEAGEGSDDDESDATDDEAPDAEEAALLRMSDGEEDEEAGGQAGEHDSEAGEGPEEEEASDNEDFAETDEMEHDTAAAGIEEEGDTNEEASDTEEQEESPSESVGSEDVSDSLASGTNASEGASEYQLSDDDSA